MILDNLPNDLDVIKKKITENSNIREYQNTYYVIKNDKKIGLARYCKENHLTYNNIHPIVINMDLPFHEITETDLLSVLQGA